MSILSPLLGWDRLRTCWMWSMLVPFRPLMVARRSTLGRDCLLSQEDRPRTAGWQSSVCSVFLVPRGLADYGILLQSAGTCPRSVSAPILTAILDRLYLEINHFFLQLFNFLLGSILCRRLGYRIRAAIATCCWLGLVFGRFSIC